MTYKSYEYVFKRLWRHWHAATANLACPVLDHSWCYALVASQSI